MSGFPRIDIWNEPSPFQNSQAYEQKNHNWNVIRNYGDYIGSYIQGIIDSYDKRFAAQISQIPQPSEVVDARIGLNGSSFNTLHDHLVNIEKTKIGYANASSIDDSISPYDMPGTILKITDLTTNSDRMKYTKISNIAFVLPRTGYTETTTANLTINPV